jgi:vitellogenic carboxypeptidase-like protein/serine carboxypeptidase-like clade 4
MATTAPRLLLLLVVCLAAGAAADGLRLPPDASFPAAQAERLIRALNLLPKESGRGDGAGGADVAPGELLERRVTLPGLPEGVGDLGHHAGYYRLPNTHDARSGRRALA